MMRYWLAVGQGLLSLQQVRVEGDVFITSVSSLSFSPFICPLFHLFSYLFYLSSPFLWEMAQIDQQVDRSLSPNTINLHHMMCNIQKGPFMHFVDNAGPDQPTHKRRLIRTFIVRLQNQWIL